MPTSDITGYQLAAASASRLLIVATSERGPGQHEDRAYLSDNGGQTWSTTLASSGSDPIIEVGFEDR
jgi:hypothetical protein